MDKTSNDFDKKIIPLIDKMYQMYQFIGMPKGAFRDFIIDGIEVYTFDEEKEVSFHDFYTKAMMEVIHQYIKDALENKNYKILINFINMTWTDADIKKSISYKKALSGLNRLNTFLDSLDFTLDASEIDSLISINPKLQAVMKTITDHDKDIIASSDFSKYDNITGILVEAYCVENGLGSLDEEEDINDSNLNLDDDTRFSMTGEDVDVNEEADFSWEEEDKRVANVRVASASDFSSMEYYSQLMRENPILKPDEEKALLEAVREGNSAAEDKLVYSNLKLVISIAKKYVGRGVPFNDLVQEGLVGLSTGIKRFDLAKSNKLSTYTTWWIRQAITRYIGDNGRNVRIPIHIMSKLGKLEQAIRILTVEYGRSPRVDEIARKMRLEESEVLELYSYRKDTVSLNKRVDDQEDTEFGAFVADPNGSLEKAHLSPDMAELIELAKDAGLSERELDIILRHVAYREVRLEDLAEEYNVTRERIRQIEAKALIKITKCRRTEGLVVYTDNPDTSLEFLQRVRKKGPVKSNENTRRKKEIEQIRDAIKKGAEGSSNILLDGDANPREEDAPKKSKKKCSKTATIFERLDVSPADYYQYIEPQLSERDKSIIEKKYGKDLENPDFSLELTQAEKYIFNGSILIKAKRMANDVRIFGKVQHGNSRVKKTIFERVGVSPADYYQYIEPRLTEKDKILIKKRYGEDLEHPDQSLAFDQDDNIAFSSIVARLKRWAVEAGVMDPSHRKRCDETIINSEPSSLTVLTNAPLTSEKDNHGGLENVILDDKKNVVAQGSADVLNSSSIQEGIDNQRKKEENMTKPKVKTIFEYLGVSPADYYKHIEPQLTEDNKALISERYGEDLEHPDQSIALSSEQTKIFYGSLVPRMKRIAVKAGLIEAPCTRETGERKKMGRKDAKTVFEIAGVSPADYYQYIEPRLTEREKSLIKARYGDDLEHPDWSLNFTRKQSTAFYSNVIPKMRRIVVREGLIESTTKTNLDSDVVSNIIPVQEDVHMETVETVTETESDVPILREQDEMANMEVADGKVLELVTDASACSQDSLEVAADESLELVSEKEKLASMGEGDLDVYLQFLAEDCAEIEKRISEKRRKLDDAISLYEKRERLLAREKELDKEIASKLNSLHTVKEKVR